MNPKAKVQTTESAIEKDASSMSPRWPTKTVVTEVVEYWHRIWNAMGPPILQSFADSMQKTLHRAFSPFTGR